MNRFMVAVLVLMTAFAGCITAPDDDSTFSAAGEPQNTTQREVDSDESMTATERVTDSEGKCTDGSNKQCAWRTIAISGSLGLDALPVSLQTFNGPILVNTGKAGEWSFEGVLRARGETVDEAREALSHISFSWGHVERGSHVFHAVAKNTARNSNHGEGASLKLTLPATLVAELSATTTNGPITVSVPTNGLAVQATNGPIEVSGSVVNVALTTTNGPISASVVPAASGSISLRTTNGVASLRVPESDKHGYDADATTTNGGASISLGDGKMTTDKPTHKHFTSNDYDSRTIQSQVRVASTNGQVSISEN